MRNLDILGKLAELGRSTWRPVRRVLLWRPFGEAYVGGKPDSVRARAIRLSWEIAYRAAVMPILLAGFYLVVVLSLTHPRRQEITLRPESFGLSSEQIELVTADGVHLKAWIISELRPSDVLEGDSWRRRRPAVVCSHDYGAARDQLLSPLAETLVDEGYHVLLLDLRGHGESGDAPVSFGQTETADVLAAVNYLTGRSDVDPERIALYGRGMGGYASILAAARQAGVRCVIAEGAYPSIDVHFGRTLSRTYLPKAIGDALGYGLHVYFGRRLAQDTAAEAVEQMPGTPVLLLTGADDDRTPLSDMGPVLQTNAAVTGMVVAGGEDGRTLSSEQAMGLVRAFLAAHFASGDATQTEVYQPVAPDDPAVSASMLAR